MKMTYKNLQCEIKSRSGLNVEIGELCAEAVAYAVCRYFSKNEDLCREYVYESYQMRLATGKKKKTRNHKCTILARKADIDGDLLQISFTVDSTGLTVQEIKPLACASMRIKERKSHS